eukprot:4627003-Karenia_brevis.AAC.1
MTLSPTRLTKRIKHQPRGRESNKRPTKLTAPSSMSGKQPAGLAHRPMGGHAEMEAPRSMFHQSSPPLSSASAAPTPACRRQRAGYQATPHKPPRPPAEARLAKESKMQLDPYTTL